jgi:hypothetical protein
VTTTTEPNTGGPLEVRLSYLAALRDAAVRASQTAWRFFQLTIVVSTVVLALALGIVDTKNEVSLGPLDLEMTLWVLLVVGSFLSSIAFLLAFAQYERAQRLAWHAVELYESLGYVAPRTDFATGRSPFGVEPIAALPHEAIWARRFSYGQLAVAITTPGVVLMLAAEWYAWRTIREDFGSSTATWLFLGVPAVTLIVVVAIFGFRVQDARKGRRPWASAAMRGPSDGGAAEAPGFHAARRDVDGGAANH